MGTVSFVLVVGGLGFAVWMVVTELRRLNTRLDMLLGKPAPVEQPQPQMPAAWQVSNPVPVPPVQAVPSPEQQAAYWARQG